MPYIGRPVDVQHWGLRGTESSHWSEKQSLAAPEVVCSKGAHRGRGQRGLPMKAKVGFYHIGCYVRDFASLPESLPLSLL